LKRPEKLCTPAFAVYQTKTLSGKRKQNDLINQACADLKAAAIAGYLIEFHSWPEQEAFKLSDTVSGFGKIAPFRKPAAALSEPLLHIHVLPVNFVLSKHQHHATSDACIVYTDFIVHNKRIILMIDYGSSHNGNMSEDIVQKYINDFHILRPRLIEDVKRKLEKQKQ